MTEKKPRSLLSFARTYNHEVEAPKHLAALWHLVAEHRARLAEGAALKKALDEAGEKNEGQAGPSGTP